MNVRKIIMLSLYLFCLASFAHAEIKHVSMRVEGMT